MLTTDQQSEIRELLEDSTAAHLADCIEMVPHKNLEALAAMISDMRGKKVQRAIIRYNVMQDVAAIISGTPGISLYSHPFLNHE